MIPTKKEIRKKMREEMEKKKQESIENRARIIAIKLDYKNEYDAVFALIMDSMKGSPWHKELLKFESFLEKRTRAFTAANMVVFWEERRRVFKVMEDKGAFGEKPEWERSNVPFAHYEPRCAKMEVV